jgi:cysteine-rich repeat protein
MMPMVRSFSGPLLGLLLLCLTGCPSSGGDTALEVNEADQIADRSSGDVSVADLLPDTHVDMPADVPDGLVEDNLDDIVEIDAFIPDSDIETDESGGCIDVYPGQVIVTEIHWQPLATPGTSGQFLELWNTGDTTLRMKGWTLSDGAGNEAAMELPEDQEFAPQTHIIVAFEESFEANGGLSPELVVSGLDLSTRLVYFSAAEFEVDRVDWNGDDWPMQDGYSLSLDPGKYNLSFNDMPNNWCLSQSEYGDGDFGTPGQDNPPCPTLPECGNEKLEDGEDCDDGANEDDKDGCTDQCKFSCLDPALDCDEPAGNCVTAVCAPSNSGQTCGSQIDDTDLPDDFNACTLDTCFDGDPLNEPVTDGIACDDGLGTDGDYCILGTCSPAVCGDKIKGPLELCDDGNLIPGDGCSNMCELETCGDLKIDSGEDCDDGNNGDDLDGCTDLCAFTCKIPVLDCQNTPGDCHTAACVANALGKVCVSQVDDLDIPVDTNFCTNDLCAQGVPANAPLKNGTECNNYSGLIGDYCQNGVCEDPLCGDGIAGPFQDCDDGNTNQCDGCLMDCTQHINFCGDSYKCGQEECDDGNIKDNDGCSALCKNEAQAGCPADMVEMPAIPGLGLAAPYCLDKWEASRSDATFDSPGIDNSLAVSQPDVVPWYSNPVSLTVLNQFSAACEAADKHICTKEEWYGACAGTGASVYVWGDVFNPETCNSVDHCCAEFCADNGIPEETCNTGTNCGYAYGCLVLLPTSQFPGCLNEAGAFDINGNVWEMVPSDDDPRGYEIRGGAYNCANPATRLQCTYNAGWDGLYAGFRCCKALPGT